jgi:hypothetical protein
MLRRCILPIPFAYGLWIAWACASALREAGALAANPGALAWSIAMRECGGGDYVPQRCMSVFRDIMSSIGEPSLWTVLWRLREFYAAFVLWPPMWFTAIAGLATALWCLVLLVGTRRSQQLRSRSEWVAASALNWPFSHPAADPQQ